MCSVHLSKNSIQQLSLITLFILSPKLDPLPQKKNLNNINFALCFVHIICMVLVLMLTWMVAMTTDVLVVKLLCLPAVSAFTFTFFAFVFIFTLTFFSSNFTFFTLTFTYTYDADMDTA